MKKVNCDLFKQGEYILFNIQRLSEFEAAIGISIGQLIQMQQWPINTIVNGFAVGMQQYKRPLPQYFKLIDELLNNDDELTLLHFQAPLMKALIASGAFGKKLYYSVYADEQTEADVLEIEAEESKAKN